MTQQSITSVLRALASDEKARPETARLRDVFDDVEAALQSGVRREAVLAALHEQGFKMTMASFKSALERIRKQRAKAGKTLPVKTSPAAPQGVARVPVVQQSPTATPSNAQPSPTPKAGDPSPAFDWESERVKKVEW